MKQLFPAGQKIKPGIEIASEYFSVSSPAGATGNILIGGRWQALETVRFDTGSRTP